MMIALTNVANGNKINPFATFKVHRSFVITNNGTTTLYYHSEPNESDTGPESHRDKTKCKWYKENCI